MSILERSDAGGVARLHMNAPERLNALSEEMLQALQFALEDLQNDTSVRAVILSGEGKAFCAGHDLKQMSAGRQNEDGGRAYFEQLFNTCAKMMQTIQALPKPVIAEVHGIATAAGCQLVASCDLAVAETNTRFGVNGVNIGLFCSTPMVALSRNIPRKHAFELLTTGDFLDAARARDLGLVNRVVDQQNLRAETEALAQQIADKLAVAVKIGKEAYYKQLEMPLAQAYEFTGRAIVENMMQRDTEEGIAAFLEKRPPDWSQ